MNYLIIAALVYVMLKYVEPMLESLVTLVQTRIQISLQYKGIHLQSYSESFDVKESAIGFNTGNDIEDISCPEDCNACPYVDECEYYGEFLDKAKNISKRETPTCKIDSAPKGK